MQPASFEPGRILSPSELILNPDGSVYHLGVRPGDVAERILIVGDPERVSRITQHWDSVRFERRNREFAVATGSLNGTALSVVSSGIGVDNIDIVVQELDALFNIDLESRTVRAQTTALQLLRLGTCGTFSPEIPPGSVIASAAAIGMEGLAWHYDVRFEPAETDLARAFVEHTEWDTRLADPYAVMASARLLAPWEDVRHVITLTANGFYGPQQRQLRVPLPDMRRMERLAGFSFGTLELANFEMECAGLYLLGRALGHEVLTVCTVLAQRHGGQFLEDPQTRVDAMIQQALNRFTA